MAMFDDLNAEINKILQEPWLANAGRAVPETTDLQLGNRGLQLTATCLYADLAESTKLVSTIDPAIACGVYKSYLNCACRIIKSPGGAITAFDGDRVMGVFLAGSRNTDAVRAAFAIDHAVETILNPTLKRHHEHKIGSYVVRHSVGIDASELLVARAGIRGSNDLIWIGRAANLAAQMESDEPEECGAFGYLRGVRDRAIILELRKRDGFILAVNYSWFERMEFNPDRGIAIWMPKGRIRVTGTGLNSQLKSGMSLFSGIVRQRVTWVSEAAMCAYGRHEIGTSVDSLTWDE